MIERPTGLAAIASIGGCSAGDQEARDAVSAQLIDPGSAQFRSVEEYDARICGEVNSRNRFGGYVGFRRFIYDKSNKSALIDPRERVSPQAREVFGEDVANMVADTAAFDRRWTAECR